MQRDLREYAAAKASYEEALAIFRKALPKDHPDIATSLNNLGSRAVRPAGVRGGEDEPRGGAGHPPQGPAQGRPVYRRLFARPRAGGAWPRVSMSRMRSPASPRRSTSSRPTSSGWPSPRPSPSSSPPPPATQYCLHSLIDATITYAREPRPRLRPGGARQGVGDRPAALGPPGPRRRRPGHRPLLDRLRQVTQQIVGLSGGCEGPERAFFRPASSDPQDAPALLRALSDERARLERQLSRAQRGLPHHPGPGPGRRATRSGRPCPRARP